MQLETRLLFLLTSVGMSLSPGPNGLLALTHGALHGTRKTLYTIFGGLLGFVVLMALCTFGIGALLETSLLWLTVLRWVGGAYLVWLGIKLWNAPTIAASMKDTGASSASARSLFRQGLLSAVTNPKGLLFFSALLPQFIDPQRSLITQFTLMAATYALTEFVTEYALASAANRIRPWLTRVDRQFNRVSGGIFVAIGGVLPLRG